MAWLLNRYECGRCGHAWDDEWSCACDDSCPRCGARHMSPIDSEDRSIIIETADNGDFSVFFSPFKAEHEPCYLQVGRVSSKAQANKLAGKVRALCYPPVVGRSNGWLVDVLDRISDLGTSKFSLDEAYRYEKELAEMYPRNRFIREKIRQQLQILRDLNILEFTEPGHYRILI